MAGKTLTKEDVQHLAKLVNLSLTDGEIDQIGEQLSDTLKYVENLDELDTSSVSGMSHTVDSTNVTFSDGKESNRTFSQEDALKNAKKKKDGFFIVDKILDK